MSQDPGFMQEKVQKGDFLKKTSQELIFVLFCFRFLWILNLEYWKRISFWKSWNALKCITKVDLKHFFVKFFDYWSSTAAFSKLFSVVEVCASLQKLNELRAKEDWETSSGTISAKHQILRYIWRKNKLCTFFKSLGPF